MRLWPNQLRMQHQQKSELRAITNGFGIDQKMNKREEEAAPPSSHRRRLCLENGDNSQQNHLRGLARKKTQGSEHLGCLLQLGDATAGITQGVLSSSSPTEHITNEQLHSSRCFGATSAIKK